jgi:arylsulfatase A-like enzyme
MRPNIVFIMADDLGYADLSCCGRRDFSTPNIDRIAERGVRFTQAYANSAVCSATRLALITGRYQYRLPLGLEEPLAGKTDVGLPPEHPTLPSLLRTAGYATALIGKWHLGVLPAFGPLQSGYDHFWGFRTGTLDYYSHRNARGEDDLWDGDVAIQQGGYMTDLLGDRAVDTIEQLARDVRHYDGGTQATYARMVQAMDRQVGRVLQALDAGGLSGNTIVVFTSDNGGERFSDTWPFTGIKTELLEGGLRVPALVCWPDRIPAGRNSEQVMITMDWLPTLLDAAGAVPDTSYPPDGISLLPVLRGERAPEPRRLFWRYKTNAQRAARDGDFKYLKIRDNTWLFDVVADPRERANLKHRRKDMFDRLVAAWDAWNATMLAEIPDSFGEAFSAADLADHIGL